MVIFRDEPPFSNSPTRSQSRIVGGENAEANSWSWTVQFRIFGTASFCGGTLISDQWVLTAAHCVDEMRIFSIHIGVHNSSQMSPAIRTPAQIFVHPDYVRPPLYINDIALIRLNSPVDISDPTNRADLICLPKREAGPNYPELGSRLAVVGWGRLSSNGPQSTILRQVRVETIADNDTRCAGSIYDVKKQFCAMVDGGGKDACQGLFISFIMIEGISTKEPSFSLGRG